MSLTSLMAKMIEEKKSSTAMWLSGPKRFWWMKMFEDAPSFQFTLQWGQEKAILMEHLSSNSQAYDWSRCSAGQISTWWTRKKYVLHLIRPLLRGSGQLLCSAWGSKSGSLSAGWVRDTDWILTYGIVCMFSLEKLELWLENHTGRNMWTTHSNWTSALSVACTAPM